jgi:predicted ATPase/DNA-binding winged helix-turn-helix (wHTH) protein
MPSKHQRPVYVSGSCEVDLARRELRVRGEAVPLGSRAFEILELLVQSSGELVSKSDLISRVWQRSNVEENTLHFHISAIRKMLGPDREMLKTIPGQGYRLLGDWGIQQQVGSGEHPSIETALSLIQPIQSNLPAMASELIGRSAALEHLRGLLLAHRVVTLTGLGGIGKSKLALEVARRLVPNFEGNAWWVELVSLSTAELVPSSVAKVLGLRLGGDIHPETVARAIGERNLLLVLDNCEHLVDAVARLTETLVSQCPRISILTTSREALRIEGEYIYRVPPLEVPPPQENSPDHILGYSAVELFITRTSSIDHDFSPNEEDLATIAAICRRLDGIPLAIEFASARAATLGVKEVASRLDDRFGLLTFGHRTALPRHQTLRAALDWSYELLSEPERSLLRRVAVFRAGFSVEAATAVTIDTDSAPTAIVDGVAGLVVKSLVARDASAHPPRWRLLETIRAYALEKLAATGEAEPCLRRHAEFFRDLLGGSTSSGYSEPTGSEMAQRVREIDNVRAALDWAFSPRGDMELGAVLTAACGPVWLHLSLMAECRERCECALRCFKSSPDLDERIRMRLALALGLALSYATDSVDRAWVALSEALEISERLGDTEMQLRALWGMWNFRIERGEHRVTRDLAERFSETARHTGNPDDVLVSDRLLGTTLHYEGCQREARRYLERFLDHYVAEGNQRHMMWVRLDQRFTARCYLARTLLLQGLADQAKWHARLAFEDAQAAGHDLTICFYFSEVAHPIATLTGDLEAAARNVSALIEFSAKQSLMYWTRYGPCLQAVLLIRRGEFVEGTALLSDSLETFRRTGKTLFYLTLLGTLAEGLAESGQVAKSSVRERGSAGGIEARGARLVSS